MRFFISLIFVLFSILTLPAQNLVLNPSFEELQKKENKGFVNYRDFNENLMHWTSPTRATPDYHNSKPEILPPGRKLANGDSIAVQLDALARSGHKMAGIQTYGKISKSYCDKTTDAEIREYIQGTLKKALIPGKRYLVRLWVSRPNYAVSTDQLGVAFVKNRIENEDCYRLFLTPQIATEQILKAKFRHWVEVSGTFTATDSFQYLIIGNFHGDNETQITSYKNFNPWNYYYIDDVYVAPALSPAEIAALKAKRKERDPGSLARRIEKEKSIVLDQVFFKTDSWELIATSTPQLTELAKWLKAHPQSRILIKGHTDNRGTESHNQQLSEKRAQSIAQFLQELGVLREQLTSRGYGSQQSAATNNTADGRKQNRRVEFEILE